MSRRGVDGSGGVLRLGDLDGKFAGFLRWGEEG